MGFSEEWDKLYRNNKHWTTWPWSDLITYVKRYAGLEPGDRVLELGCGVGANIPFFASLGVVYHGMDGSSTAIAAVQERFIGYEDNIFLHEGDFTKSIPLSRDGQKYKLIIDRAAVIYNTVLDILQTIENVDRVLAPDGMYIGIDWFSIKHYSCNCKAPITLENIDSGPFAGVGVVHFTDTSELCCLWNSKKWDLMNLRLKWDTFIDVKTLMVKPEDIASYDFVVKRRR